MKKIDVVGRGGKKQEDNFSHYYPARRRRKEFFFSVFSHHHPPTDASSLSFPRCVNFLPSSSSSTFRGFCGTRRRRRIHPSIHPFSHFWRVDHREKVTFFLVPSLLSGEKRFSWLMPKRSQQEDFLFLLPQIIIDSTLLTAMHKGKQMSFRHSQGKRKIQKLYHCPSLPRMRESGVRSAPGC